MAAKVLVIDLIRIDGGTQSRESICETTVAEYCDLATAGVDLPPVDVYFDGTEYWLADGFHRMLGRKRAGKASIQAEIHNGTVRDAILHSVSANQAHGLKRTHKDKRKAVSMLFAVEGWAEKSDRVIADKVGVGVELVGSIRKQLSETDSSSPAAEQADKPRTGKDGKKRKPPKPRAPKAPKSPAVPKAEPSPAKPVPPKNGAAKPDVISIDGKIDDFFGKLIRAVDDRAEASERGAHHRRAIALLNEVKNILTRWQKGQAL